MITVLIADDHDIVREGVKQIVSETSDIVVGGEARSGAEALDLARGSGWDVITAAFIETVRALQPLATLIVLTGYSSPALQLAATVHGAAAVLSKPQSVTCLGDLIHNIPHRDPSERSL